MKHSPESQAPKAASGKLPKAARRHQLLDVARTIVRQEGTDSLTLGYLASQAGVSKPVAYEHFGTRAGLLAEIYKLLDRQQVFALQEALRSTQPSLDDTADALATTYIHCVADTSGEIYAIRAALSGSEIMGTMHQELIAGYIQLFISALESHSALLPAELHRRCVGLVGAGDALSLLMVRGQCSEQEATQTFAFLIRGGLYAPASQR